MIRTEHTSAELTRARVLSWLKAERERHLQIADAADVDEKTIRLAIRPDKVWDPRVSTLRKLEAVMAKSTPKTKRRAA